MLRDFEAITQKRIILYPSRPILANTRSLRNAMISDSSFVCPKSVRDGRLCMKKF